MKLELSKGENLSDDYVALMNRQRIHEYRVNTKDFRKNELDSLFFFIKEETQIKAFGMLKPVTLTYQQHSFHILGIGNIIAIEKGAGYGKRLMTEIKSYLIINDQIGLGFCKQTIAGFYTNCGYDIVDNLSSRFRYVSKATYGRATWDHPRRILCFDADESFIQTLQSSNDLITINVPFW